MFLKNLNLFLHNCTKTNNYIQIGFKDRERKFKWFYWKFSWITLLLSNIWLGKLYYKLASILTETEPKRDHDWMNWLKQLWQLIDHKATCHKTSVKAESCNDCLNSNSSLCTSNKDRKCWCPTLKHIRVRNSDLINSTDNFSCCLQHLRHTQN